MEWIGVVVSRSPRRLHDRARFFKYVSASTAKIILATRRLRWSSPSLFNDRFDASQELRLDFSEEDLNRILWQTVASSIERGDQLVTSEPFFCALLDVIRRSGKEARLKIASEMRMSPTSVTPGQIAAFERLRKNWKDMAPTLRVLCLSEARDIMPMWSHYAEEGAGLVLEFECVDELDSAWLVARPVTYSDAPPAIADVQNWVNVVLGIGKSVQNLFEEYQYHKTTSWAHEKEWRIASAQRPGETSDYFDYAFHPQELAGVTFGYACSEKSRTDIRLLLAHGLEHVSVAQAVCGPRSSLVFESI